MDALYAPWRSKYLKTLRVKSSRKNCVFCVYSPKNKVDNSLILYKNSHAYVALNKFPYTNGHILIIPKSHIAEIEELPAKEYEMMYLLLSKSVTIIKRAYHPHGFNIGMNIGIAAGAGIKDHLHLHVIPRWSGDTNFLPTIGKTKVISESLKDGFKKLKPYFDKLGV